MEDLFIDNYIESIQKELAGDKIREPLLGIETKVKADPKEVNLGVDTLGTIFGLIAGTAMGNPTIQRYMEIKTHYINFNYKYYFQHTPWNHSRVSAAVKEFKRDVVKGQDGVLLLYTERVKRDSRKVRCFLQGYENREGNIVRFNGKGFL